jgi:hypothetical protein
MKNTFLTTLAASFVATASFAGQLGSGGVSSIRDNGRINGDPSWTITCNSGWGVVRRSGNAWANNTGSTYSDRLWSLSLEDFAAKMCE